MGSGGFVNTQPDLSISPRTNNLSNPIIIPDISSILKYKVIRLYKYILNPLDNTVTWIIQFLIFNQRVKTGRIGGVFGLVLEEEELAVVVVKIIQPRLRSLIKWLIIILIILLFWILGIFWINYFWNYLEKVFFRHVHWRVATHSINMLLIRLKCRFTNKFFFLLSNQIKVIKVTNNFGFGHKGLSFGIVNNILQ